MKLMTFNDWAGKPYLIDMDRFVHATPFNDKVTIVWLGTASLELAISFEEFTRQMERAAK